MSDALERLKKRQRPTVPTRDSSLVPVSSQPPVGVGTSMSRYPDIETAKGIDSLPSTTQETVVSLQTKQSTLRLEQGVSDRLQALVRDHGLCREVLIEAMFEYCEAHPEVVQVVIEKSKIKNEHRQQIANMKRAKSMIQRFGTGS